MTTHFPSYPEIQPTALHDLLTGATSAASGEPLVVLDCLPADQFVAHRLPGALNACVYEVGFAEQVRAQLPPAGANPKLKVVVYGADEMQMEATMAAAKLFALGYENVAVLTGGRAAWAAAGLPLEGERRAEPFAPAPEASVDPALPLREGEYALAPDESTLAWRGYNANGQHHGSAVFAAGTLRLGRGAASGRFQVDMTSLRNLDLTSGYWAELLIAHLGSEDFFHVTRFPEAVFTLESLTHLPGTRLSEPNTLLAGQLTLRGTAHPLEATAIMAELPETNDKGAGYALTCSLSLDRTLWGALYGSSKFFKYLGMHLVYDTIQIDARIVLRN